MLTSGTFPRNPTRNLIRTCTIICLWCKNLIEYIGLLGVVIGGLIVLSSSLVTEYMRSKREEKRWREEEKSEREKSATEFFRNNYGILAPFLAMCSEWGLIMGGSLMLGEKIEKTQGERIIGLFPKFLKAYRDIASTGYLELLPPDLRDQMFRMGSFLSAIARIFKEKPKYEDWDDKDHEFLFRFAEIKGFVRNGIRQLLNVESLEVHIYDDEETARAQSPQ